MKKLQCSACDLIRAFRLSIMLRCKRLLQSQHVWEFETLKSEFSSNHSHVKSRYATFLVRFQSQQIFLSNLIVRFTLNEEAAIKVASSLQEVEFISITFEYGNTTDQTADLLDVLFSVFFKRAKKYKQTKFSDTHSSQAKLLY